MATQLDRIEQELASLRAEVRQLGDKLDKLKGTQRRPGRRDDDDYTVRRGGDPMSMDEEGHEVDPTA